MPTMSDASETFASLSPTLLARKGGAKPAMRSQLAAAFVMPDKDQAPANADGDKLEDLGWNDMGSDSEQHEAEVVHLTPAPANEETAAEAEAMDREADEKLNRSDVKPAVRKQQEEIADRLDMPVNKAAPAKPRKSALAQGKRAAFTLRLDAERHLKLKLATTIRNRSAQALVTEALDKMLGKIPELDSLAAQVKQK